MLHQHCNPLLPAKLQGQNHILDQFIEAVSDKKHFEIEVHFFKVRFQYSTAAAVFFVVYFTLAMCKPQVTIQTLIYFRKRCFAEMNIVATCITLSAIICVVLLYKVVVSDKNWPALGSEWHCTFLYLFLTLYGVSKSTTCHAKHFVPMSYWHCCDIYQQNNTVT